MAEVKTIKDVDEDTCHKFKSIASRDNIKMGQIFEKMVNEYTERNEMFWNKILNSEKILSKEEAKDINKIVLRLRKDKGFKT